MAGAAAAAASLYSSATNLSHGDSDYQALLEKKEYIKLLAQGICNVKCITEYVSARGDEPTPRFARDCI